MEADVRSPGWRGRATCRWVLYAVLWTVTVVVGLISSFHFVMQVVAAFLGVVLGATLLMLFMTLFEATFSAGDRRYMPLTCIPYLGIVVILVSIGGLISASGVVLAKFSYIEVRTATQLREKLSGLERSALPRTVCVRKAFVKTDWEAGKLECQNEEGHVVCRHAFVAAPIFDDKGLADAHLPDNVQAWAVSEGAHVDANYRPDGRLCGYMRGVGDFDFYIDSYRLAVERVIEKQALTLTAGLEGSAVPLQDRPYLMTYDPAEYSAPQQVCLFLGLLCLLGCPCVSPLGIAAILSYYCSAKTRRPARLGRTLESGQRFDDEDFEGALVE
eukprot:gnl/MRDRNA2_/MRDRNA2_29743_c0_seq1.p1 gnl/MRDRNA2_/MRDRNA2_29743_c0~~gnl/MRDRNA2_/MRDRNA2_29743_c0_seq1.p1  ORF type:complete len:343 (-),score=48.02 gnl/MRDRNA2_/MRDRNA2_29743_c0_seq1:106-1092(-)